LGSSGSYQQGYHRWEADRPGWWVARVKKSQIEALIRDLRDTHPWYQPGSPMSHMEKRLKDLRADVAGLKDYDVYAVVATEL
jgi:hypothetical protein